MLNNAIVSIYGGQIYTVRWQLQNITTLVLDESCGENILKSYCKVILICPTGNWFINKLKLRDPFKSFEIVSSIRLQWILPIHQCDVDKFFVFQTPDGNKFAGEIGLECEFI